MFSIVRVASQTDVENAYEADPTRCAILTEESGKVGYRIASIMPLLLLVLESHKLEHVLRTPTLLLGHSCWPAQFLLLLAHGKHFHVCYTWRATTHSLGV